MTIFINGQKSKTVLFFLGLLFATLTASAVLAASETPEETLAWCETLAIAASEAAHAAMNECNYPLVQEALDLANDAEQIAAKVSGQAQDTENPQLALSAYIVCNHVKKATADVIRAAQHIAAHSPDSQDVQAANILLELAESTKKANKATMEIALRPILGIPKIAEAFSK